MSPSQAPALVLSTSAAVADLASALAGVPLLAVDTEFHAEQRLLPTLMTVQLATADGRAWLVDALQADLSPLGPVLDATEVVVHGGLHDVHLLTAATGWRPRALLDTQRLAGLAGSPYPARLADLMARWLGGSKGPSMALTDWSRRPLSEEQVRYALEDVASLPALATRLSAEVQARGRMDWARQASLELWDEARAPARPLDGWRAWDVAPALDADERRVLAGLMRWRDDLARERGQPAHYLLGDSMALALARTRPTSLQALATDRRLASGLRQRHGPALVACIQRALAGPAPPPVPPQAPGRATLLQAWAQAQAEQTAIAAGLALPPTWLHRVAEEGPAALAGWRTEALGPALRRLWAGGTAVGLDARGGVEIIALDDRGR
ncbi:HRDC domain-containing protein [Myxococcota bacterium]|nr:HRDC domain-containing protein [Myxococcota bacterium]